MSVGLKILEQTAIIQKALDEINSLAVQGDFKSASEAQEPEQELPPVEKAAPIKSELGVDWEKVDYLKLGMMIKPKGYLEGDLWGNINKTLFADGYRWSKEERAWLFQPEAEKQSQPKKAAPAKSKTSKVTRLSDIREGMKSVTVEGTLLDDPVQRDVNTNAGPKPVTNFRIDDGTAEARVSLWEDLANSAMSLVTGNEIQLTSLIVKPPYEGVNQLSGGKWTKITVL